MPPAQPVLKSWHSSKKLREGPGPSRQLWPRVRQLWPRVRQLWPRVRQLWSRVRFQAGRQLAQVKPLTKSQERARTVYHLHKVLVASGRRKAFGLRPPRQKAIAIVQWSYRAFGQSCVMRGGMSVERRIASSFVSLLSTKNGTTEGYAQSSGARRRPTCHVRVEPSASSTRTLASLSPPFLTLNYHEPLREHALLACNVL